MSMIPYLFEDPLRQVRSFDRLLSNPEELIQPLNLYSWPNEYLRDIKNQLSQFEKDTSITVDKDKFQANIDVQQFKPEEISVKITDDNMVVVEGKHEEKQDEHGFISRHFVRKYALPENCDVQRLKSRLSSDGVLTVTAPTVKEKQVGYKEVPIQRTGKPVKRVEHKKTEKPAVKQSKK